MSAGFGHTEMTALHAAVVTAAIATDGRSDTGLPVASWSSWEVIESPARQPLGRAMTEDSKTCVRCSPKRSIQGRPDAFKKWPSKLNGIKVGGKTGTLARRRDGGYIHMVHRIRTADKPEIRCCDGW